MEAILAKHLLQYSLCRPHMSSGTLPRASTWTLGVPPHVPIANHEEHASIPFGGRSSPQILCSATIGVALTIDTNRSRPIVRHLYTTEITMCYRQDWTELTFEACRFAAARIAQRLLRSEGWGGLPNRRCPAPSQSQGVCYATCGSGEDGVSSCVEFNGGQDRSSRNAALTCALVHALYDSPLPGSTRIACSNQ